MKKILALLTTLFVLKSSAFASIAVSPTVIEIDANKIRNNYATCAVEVKGDAQQPMRFKAYAGYFTISKDSSLSITLYSLTGKSRQITLCVGSSTNNPSV